MPIYGSHSPRLMDNVRPLHVGLLNNMPDGALEATERQYRQLLETASGDLPIRFSLYALPQIPRGEWGRNQVSHRYAGIDQLWDSDLDGLIVTGAEPHAADLGAEPYWDALTEVIEWAREETSSTVWSCLAAHAAVQHLDGVRRRPLGDKRFGVLPCTRDCAHSLTTGLPTSFSIPHSRWNDVAAADLTHAGYQLLTRLEDGSADAWVKEQGSLFVFLQGHPEYESGTLLLEYRRDIGRFLRGERETFPCMPERFFDPAAQQQLTELKTAILAGNPTAAFPGELDANLLPNTWRPVAVRLYANWLQQLAEDRVAAGTSSGRYLFAASAAGD